MSDTEANEAEETGEVDESEFHSFKLDLEQLIHFFDEVPEDSIQQATPMVSFFGEDLTLALLRVYCEAKGYEFNLLRGACTMQVSGGSRLDGWVRVDTDPEKKSGPVYYFQTEIKNWSAHALDGVDISLDIRKNPRNSTRGRGRNKETFKETWDDLRFSRFRQEFGFFYRQKGSNEDGIPVKDKPKDNEAGWDKILDFDSEGKPEKLKEDLEFFYAPQKVMKVIRRMTLNKDRILPCDKNRNWKVHPLLCYWFAPYPSPKAGAYESEDKLFDSDEFFNLVLSEQSKKFWKKDKRESFNLLYVFSLSSFVRNILDRDSDIPESMKATFASSPKVETDGTKIKVKMKILGGRKRWIDRIFPPQ